MNIWFISGAFAVSVGWLLPVHYLPWSAFHSNAWVAGLLLLFVAISFGALSGRQPFHMLPLLAGALSLTPLLQLAAGQIMLAGTAWITSLHLIGIMLAMLIGAHWQLCRGAVLADALFLAFGVAATLSVGTQLCQWTGANEGLFCSADWIVPRSGDRIGGNVAQPNQLATLLLLGVVAYAWAWLRCLLRGWIAVFAMCFLLFGIGLTGSRTALMSAAVMLLCIWYWRDSWPSKAAPHVATVLFFTLALLFATQQVFADFFLLDYESTLQTRSKNESRPAIWAMFFNAALERPWLGYGWNQSALAQLMTATAGATTPIAPTVAVSYAHNLFLDLVLWLGIPLGLATSFALMNWLFRAAVKVKGNQEALLLLGVLAMGVHAMLELPLYYAYFLLPLGLMVGMIDVRLGSNFVLATGRRSVVCLWLVCSALFVATVTDYFVIERSYSALRLNAARIQHTSDYETPNVLVLTQLRDLIAVARLEPSPNMSQNQIKWLSGVAMVYPAEHNLLKLATALALNGQTPQATFWLEKLCHMYGKERRDKSRDEWQRLQNQFPQLAGVLWPKTHDSQ